MKSEDLQKLVEILGGESVARKVVDRKYLVHLSTNPNHLDEVKRKEFELDRANFLSHTLYPYPPTTGREIERKYQRWFATPGRIPLGS